MLYNIQSEPRTFHIQNYLIVIRHIFDKNDVMTNAIMHLCMQLFVGELILSVCLQIGFILCYITRLLIFHVKHLRIDGFERQKLII